MLTEYNPSILGRTHDMIEQHRNLVTLVNVPACCHPPPLSKESGRSKLRGMYPAEIQKSEEAHDSLPLKYLIASQTLSGSAFKKGEKTYQDFAILVHLRNDLMHVKPRDAFSH